jgi:ribose 5-phosphate isomerase B
MRIAFAADDENETTRAVVAYLSQGHSVLQVATATDWPSIGEAVGQAVSIGDADVGVVMCWTGTGTAIAANKVRGVRAALAWEPWPTGTRPTNIIFNTSLDNLTNGKPPSFHWLVDAGP